FAGWAWRARGGAHGRRDRGTGRLLSGPRRRAANADGSGNHSHCLDPDQPAGRNGAQYWRDRPSARLPPMAHWYPLIVLLHLVCAIVFVGAVCFEVLVLESFHTVFDAGTMARLEAAVMARVRRFMPVVVVLLFASGGLLFDLRCDGLACVGSSTFGW